MADWWNALTSLQQFFYYIAIPFTVLLLIQAIMTIIGLGDNGGDADADVDTDADTDFDTDMDSDFDSDVSDSVDAHDSGYGYAGFRFFTVRGVIAFFTIFGWTGLSLTTTTLTIIPIILISVVAGFIAMLLIGLMFFAVKKLQSSGNIKMGNAIGRMAEVYIPIPASRSGRGKVMVCIQERLIEVEAITDDNEKILTGKSVHVVGSIGNILIVKK
jgi:membrane protein implicated in regulation of membrane protease activity